ncbi:MAG TPA: archease [Gemmatimonadaceae bacterium]|nr:archease [Gemmatimonadaceae bacterium]
MSRTEEHVGEWKVTLRADSLAELFIEIARVIARTCGPTRAAASPWTRITLTARDDATLLADWANELLGRAEVEHAAFVDVRALEVHDGELDAEIRGYPVVDWRSPLKAATYHGLTLDRRDGRWTATVLFDV